MIVFLPHSTVSSNKQRNQNKCKRSDGHVTTSFMIRFKHTKIAPPLFLYFSSSIKYPTRGVNKVTLYSWHWSTGSGRNIGWAWCETV